MVTGSFAIDSKVPTKIDESPQDVMLATGNDTVDFRCVASTDSSTPLTLSWRKDDAGLDTHDPRVNLTEDSTLLSFDLHDLSLEEINKKYVGVYKCIARNGYSSQEKSANLALGVTIPETDKGMVSTEAIDCHYNLVLYSVPSLPFFQPLLISCGCYLISHDCNLSFGSWHLGTLLLTWFNFNPSMDK